MISKMSGKFRLNYSWDPALIVGQIVTVQTFWYLSFGSILILGSVLTGTELSLGNIFSYKAINFSDKHGVLGVVAYFVNALVSSLALWVIVRRTKQCLDFTVTAYVIHLVLCWCYNGSLPATVSWWLLTIACVTVMCVSGEFLCLRSELQDIPLLGASSNGGGPISSTSASNVSLINSYNNAPIVEL